MTDPKITIESESSAARALDALHLQITTQHNELLHTLESFLDEMRGEFAAHRNPLLTN